MLTISQIQTDLTSGSIADSLKEHIGCNEKQLKKLVHGVLQQIQGSDNDALKECSIQSFGNAMKEAHDYQLPINSRGFGYLVPYKGKANFQPGYHGYIYKLKQVVSNFGCDTKFIWPEDKLEVWSESGNDQYNYRPAQPFRNDYTNISGIMVHATWSDGDIKRSVVKLMPKAEIDKRQAVAKSNKFWGKWYSQQAKKTALRWALGDEFKTHIGDLMDLENEFSDPDSAPTEHVFGGSMSRSDEEERLKRDAEAFNQDDNVTIDGDYEEVQDGDDTNGDNMAGGDPGDDNGDDQPVIIDNEDPVPEEGGAAAEDDSGDSPGGRAGAEDLSETGDPGAIIHGEDEQVPWDGKTVIIGKRKVTKDWDKPTDAYRYLKEAALKKKSQSERRKIVQDNRAVMGALINSGAGHLITEIGKIIQDGEADEDHNADGSAGGSEPTADPDKTETNTEGTEPDPGESGSDSGGGAAEEIREGAE